MGESLIEVPRSVLVAFVREVWLKQNSLPLATLLDGGRDRFVQSFRAACGDESPWPNEVRRPTVDELSDVFDTLIREGAS